MTDKEAQRKIKELEYQLERRVGGLEKCLTRNVAFEYSQATTTGFRVVQAMHPRLFEAQCNEDRLNALETQVKEILDFLKVERKLIPSQPEQHVLVKKEKQNGISPTRKK